MPTIPELHEAFQTLELEPSASLESVQRQHALLMHVWHPDRLPADFREQATKKIQDINAARDQLEKHFESINHSVAVLCIYEHIPATQLHPKQLLSSHARSEVTVNAGDQPNAEFDEWEVNGTFGSGASTPRTDTHLLCAQLASPALRHVRQLRLNNCWITNYNDDINSLAAPALAVISNLQSLRQLGLRHCAVFKDTNLSSITAQLQHLEHLDLHDCYGLTNALLLELVNCSSLKTLCICGTTEITREAADAFAKARPDCKVNYDAIIRRKSSPITQGTMLTSEASTE